jgi:hypothetical protein
VTASSAPRRRLASAIGAHTSRSVTQGQARFYARVMKLNPLGIEVLDKRVTISEENILITQWVRRYEYEHGLGIGDTVVVDRMPTGDFLVSDVVSTKDIQGGPGEFGAVVASSDPTWTGTAPAGGGGMTVNPSHHIIKKVPYRDESGNVVGYVPIYGGLP